MKHRIRATVLSVILVGALLLSSCGNAGTPSSSGAGVFHVPGAKETLRILSGSENAELEPILERFAKEHKINIEMTYKGSLDIMRELQNGSDAYDAVWPASSLWISVGDQAHRVKHLESISTTPVVFGVRKSIAEKLGFVGRDVSVRDLLTAISAGKLNFCMTSATQSNSGASAYIGFLYALLGNPGILTAQDLEKPELVDSIRKLLAGVNRSSGSSDWLKDMFLDGNYDAMVNYECLIISANQQLVKQGKEPLYVIYPYDGLSIADSPLGYVDLGKSSKESAFLELQKYLLTAETQDAIQQTGRRTGYTGVSDKNRAVFNSDWGIDTKKILSYIKMPSADVLFKALNLYQTEFKKPALNVYCLDFSGSMAGEGNTQLVKAMEQILIQKNAEKNFLQASPNEVNIVVTFDDTILNTYKSGGSAAELADLYNKVAQQKIGGGTDIYTAAREGMRLLASYDVKQYSPAIILMTDGKSQNSLQGSGFTEFYRESGLDVPVFSIMFGDAEDAQLKALATLSNARVFDGRQDLIDAFRKVKGYN